MSETVNIEIIGYSRSELAKTINTEFSELITPTTTSATTAKTTTTLTTA